MEELSELQSLLDIGAEPIGLLKTLLNFIICVSMSFIVRSFYIKYSYSLTGKMHIASVLPILASVIFLVIIIVKSSLALSLGLVGALSIVRFRTPIKEPEELVYLFLVISIGLGYGAGFTLITTIITFCILFVIYMWLFKKESLKTNEYTLIVDWKDPILKFDNFLNIIKNHTDTVKLVRLDSNKLSHSTVLIVTPSPGTSLEELTKKIKEDREDVNVSFFEAKTNW
jgi:hypothetical protein